MAAGLLECIQKDSNLCSRFLSRYVKTVEVKECVEKLKVRGERAVCVDVLSRWPSTLTWSMIVQHIQRNGRTSVDEII